MSESSLFEHRKLNVFLRGHEIQNIAYVRRSKSWPSLATLIIITDTETVKNRFPSGL